MDERSSKDSLFGRIADISILPIEYYRIIEQLNILIQSELRSRLLDNTRELGGISIFITPGSDARLEKGSFMSPLEVIAIADDSIDLEDYKQNLIKTLDKISEMPIAKIIEIKNQQSSLVTAYNGRYQPGRIADARLMYGSPQSLKDIKIKLSREIINLHGSSIDKIASLKRDARKVVERGINKINGIDAIHFNLKTGIVFFNPEAHQLSFKIGPLRLVQNTLLIEEVKHIRRENDENFIGNLDPNIINRLSQLSDDKMVNLTRSSIDEVSLHYAFFLRLYHRSERAYSQNKQVVLQLTQQEVVEISKRLQALKALLEKFEIKKQSR